MIGQILRKDWRLLWPLATFAALIQLCLEWVHHSYGLFGGSASLPQLTTLLTIAWFAALALTVIAVVQRDAIPSLDQDWLIRPLRRTDLMMAKLLFVLITVIAPMLLLDFAAVTAAGFAPSATLSAIAIKETLVITYVLIPVMALAATAADMTELLIFGAALALLYGGTQSAATLVLGASACSTCETSIEWIQHLWQHCAILLGAIVILWLQYYRRATVVSRTVAIVGAVMLALAQLPWNTAFAIQRWLAPALAAASQITLAVVPQAAQAQSADHVDRAPADAARVGEALLRGNLAQADKYVRALAHTARVELPIQLQIRGLKADELLQIDRSEIVLFDEAGRQLYDGTADDTLTVQGPRPANESAPVAPAQQRFVIPLPRQQLVSAAVRSEIHNSLSLLQVHASFTIAALQGQERAAEIGNCATRLEGDVIELACVQLRPRPICFSATLYGPDGEHNPRVLKCDPDYRPYLPPVTNALTFYGLEIPVRDPQKLMRYSVDPSQLSRAYLLVKTYSVREHFKRTAALPHLRSKDYVGSGP